MALEDINGNPINLTPRPGTQAPPVHKVDPNEPSAPRQVVTAFTVFLLPNGRWAATDNLAEPLIAMRPASQDDLISGSSNVVVEITARKAADMAAATTIQTQLAMARQAQSQQMSTEEQAAAAAAMSGRVPPAFSRS